MQIHCKCIHSFTFVCERLQCLFASQMQKKFDLIMIVKPQLFNSASDLNKQSKCHSILLFLSAWYGKISKTTIFRSSRDWKQEKFADCDLMLSWSVKKAQKLWTWFSKRRRWNVADKCRRCRQMKAPHKVRNSHNGKNGPKVCLPNLPNRDKVSRF